MTQPLPPEQNTAAYQAATGRTRAQMLAYAAALWASLPNYRDADIARFIAAIVPRVQAGQLAMANLTSVYLARAASTVGNPVKPLPVDPKLVQDGRGVPATEVYRRPAIETYSALADKVPFGEAVKRGQTRLDSLVSTDLQMAKVRQARQSLEASGPAFYRRVLRGPHSCAKCIIASTRRYRKSELLPVHPGCDCDVEPLHDPKAELVLDEKALLATHEQVGNFANIANPSAKGYQDILIVHNHGEIGPVLGWRGEKFTSAAEIH
jgi:hypothetical protein